MNKFAYFKMMFPQEMIKIAAEQDAKKADKNKKKEQKKQQKQKAKAEDEASKSNRRRAGKWHSELLGHFTGPAISALGGAGIGAALGGAFGNEQNGWSAGKGALAGAGTGAYAAILANLIGNASGLIVGPRTLAHQNRYNSSTGSTIGNYLFPGMTGFNAARTLATKDEQDAVLQEALLNGKLKGAGLA